MRFLAASFFVHKRIQLNYQRILAVNCQKCYIIIRNNCHTVQLYQK